MRRLLDAFRGIDTPVALMGHIPAAAPDLLLYAPLAVILAETTIVQPDVVRLAPARLHARHGMPFLRLVDPDARATETFVLVAVNPSAVAASTCPRATDCTPARTISPK